MMLLALLAAAAGAPATPNDGDLRCMAIASRALANASPERQLSVVTGMMYFMGRINGRSPKADVEEGIRRIEPSLENESVWEAEAKRCAAVMQDRAVYLQKMGHELQSK
jgi:hypothetical protein